MKALLTRRMLIIASVAVLLAIITIVSVNVFNTTGPVTGFANTVTRPVRALASTVAGTYEEIFTAIYRYEDLQKRHNELLRLVAQYEQDNRDNRALVEEIEELRQLLKFRELHPSYTDVMATFVSWNSDNWSSSFTINIGYANSDIKPGMGVATEHGMLIGQVFDVGADTSTVITVLDTKFSAVVNVGHREGEDVGTGSVTAEGNFSYMRSGLLTLNDIDADLLVRKGDMVVTSGDGAVFPPGLIVGEVDDVLRHTSGIGRFATIMPLHDINSITTVFVITSFDSPDVSDAPVN